MEYVSRILASVAAMAVLAVSLPSAAAQCNSVEIQKLIASTPGTNDQFGISVDIAGDIAVVGSWLDDDQGTNSGSATVYRQVAGQWIEEQVLTAGDGVRDESFGFSVAVGNGRIVIGAPDDDVAGLSTGAVYVFFFDGLQWSPDRKLVASDAATGDQFGHSVAISNGVIAVGAWQRDGPSRDSGAVYLFRRMQGAWAEEKVISNPTFQVRFFGASVGLDGNALVVGSPLDSTLYLYGGAAFAYRYDGSGWSFEQQLIPSGVDQTLKFASCVAISGDAILVGAHLQDFNLQANTGAAYVFRHDGNQWNQEQQINAALYDTGDKFGWSVDLSGNSAIVGVPDDDDRGRFAGSAYVFRFNGQSWVVAHKLFSSDADKGDTFGWNVAIDGESALVGSWMDDTAQVDSGSAYAYEAKDLALSLETTGSISKGDNIDLHVCAGVPGKLAMLFVVENGNLHATSANALFDTEGQWKLNTTLPSSPGPVDMTFRVLAFGTGSKILQSNDIVVPFQ
jgi:hypothetical protein